MDFGMANDKLTLSMTTEKFLFTPEEDSDFIPIIPINEDGEDKDLVIPEYNAFAALAKYGLVPGRGDTDHGGA
jgi:hypothetical protein